jgi:L-alanine-DL-glutamate epimerase-like enolase superfamily enzyme
VQIDTGRIGGITTAYEVAQYAHAHGTTYVNHTFTTPLALCASLQPFAGIETDDICEYPIDASPLAQHFTYETLALDGDGRLHIPERPGLGMTPNLEALRQYLVPLEITVRGKVIYRTPDL